MGLLAHENPRPVFDRAAALKAAEALVAEKRHTLPFPTAERAWIAWSSASPEEFANGTIAWNRHLAKKKAEAAKVGA